jgi:hypothetical protein
MTKPAFLELLMKVMLVPTLMQKGLFSLASGMPGFAVAKEPWLRLMSMEQGEEAEPQVLAAAQIPAGLEAEQTSPFHFLFSVLANDEATEEKWKNEQATESCEIVVDLHRAPHSEEIQKGKKGELVDAGRTLPVNDVDEFPGILIELELELALLVDGELASGIQDAGALALVGIVDVELAGGEVEGLRLRVGIDFAEAELAIGDPANLASSWSGNHADEGDVVAQSAGDGTVPDSSHLREGVDQTVVPTLFEGPDKDLAILRSGEVINFNADATTWPSWVLVPMALASMVSFLTRAREKKGSEPTVRRATSIRPPMANL